MGLFAVLLRVVAVWVCYKKAKELGRNPAGYVLLALIIPFIAIIWSALVKPTGVKADSNSGSSKPKKKDDNLLDD